MRLAGSHHPIGVIPDRVFGLEIGGHRSYFFLEADRGTMPVMRRGLDRTSFRRKLLAYHATWREKLHLRHFGLPSFRVLTVTSSPERAAHVIQASRSIAPDAPGLFLFSDQEALRERDFLSHGFLNGRGETVRLLD